MPDLLRSLVPGRPFAAWAKLVAVLLAPLLAAGAFVWATYHVDDRVDRIVAAVVNNDEPVTIDGQYVPLGRQLTSGLIAGDPDDPDTNLSWVLSDDTDAADGLASGRYAAVVTIPAGFSAAATSTATPDEAERAVIEVQTARSGAIGDATIAQAISDVAARTLGTELTKNYLDNIYLGFNTLKKQFGEAADGAAQLADAGRQIADGVGQSAEGADELSDGLGELADGAKQLSDSSPELRTGGKQLADGLSALSRETAALPTQTTQLADGAKAVAEGATASGQGVRTLSGLATQLSEGLTGLAAGVQQLVSGLGTAADGLSTMADTVEATGTTAGGIATDLATLRQGLDDAARGTISCPTDYTADACAAYRAGAQAAATPAVAQLDGDEGLLARAGVVSATVTAVAPQLDAAATGLKDAATAGNTLVEAAKGLAKLAAGLASGLDDLADGLDDLAGGADQVATGTQQLATGLGELHTGIATLATGVSTYVTGVSTYTEGADQLATGIGLVAPGAEALADGLQQLATGAATVADRTDDLADGLGEGAKQLPSYDTAQRLRLGQVVSDPVTVAGAAQLPEISATTWLVALTLFAAAIAAFAVVAAVPRDALRSSRSSWELAGRSYLPVAVLTVVSSIVLALIARLVLHLDAPHTFGVAALGLFGGLAFAAVNQALVVWLGAFGRVLAVASTAVVAAAGLISAVPAGLAALASFQPATPLLTGLRALVTGGPGLPTSVGLLAAWFLIGAVATVVGIARKRTVPAGSLAVA